MKRLSTKKIKNEVILIMKKIEKNKDEINAMRRQIRKDENMLRKYLGAL